MTTGKFQVHRPWIPENPRPMFCAVDPGNVSGYAYADSGRRLISCGITSIEEFTPPAHTLECSIVECPVIYPNSKAPPADILKLTVDVGRYFERLTSVGAFPRLVTPHAWKGTLPKSVHHARVWAALTAEEQAIVSVAGKGMAPGLRHNMLDAIGLLLFLIDRKLR